MRLGVAALARPTFDLDAAGTFADAALATLRDVGGTVVGDGALLVDTDAVSAAAAAWRDQDLDALVVVQATFADATLMLAAAATTNAPLVVWSAPEPRRGGHLRRNSLCGVNLAGYSLRRADRRFAHVHVDPAAPDASTAVAEAVANASVAPPEPAGRVPAVEPSRLAGEVVERLRRSRVGVIGRRPDGFEPCDFDAAAARSATGVQIERVPLDDLFVAARAAPTEEVVEITARFGDGLDLSPLGDEGIEPSARLQAGIRHAVDRGGWSAVATRCWPECFTEFGGAACAAQAFLNQDLGIPALCEADAYGAVTSLLLQWLAGGPAFVADLVDVDEADDSAVVWHCGLAPVAMAGGPPRGARHPNRDLPLLNEFVLRPGRVTVARLSQSRHRTRLVVGGGEMLDRPRPFSGTSGTLRFDRLVGQVLATVMGEGLEHHYGIVYGDVREDLRGVAALLDLPVVEL